MKINIKDERGSVVVIILVLFMAMTLFFFGLYQIVISDYLKSSNGINEVTENSRQSNIVESLARNYKTDMLNDIEYKDLKLEYSYDEKYENLFKIEYLNYMYEFIKKDEEGNDSPDKGTFGRFKWLVFNNYTQDEETGSREYIIESNWKDDDKLKEVYYSEGKLLVRVPIYLKIDFDDSVSSINLTIGNQFETKEYNLINRPNGTNIYKLEDVPYSSDTIVMKNNDIEEPYLGTTKFSLLKSREIDVEVYSIDKLGDKQVKKLTKSLNIELGRNANYMYFD